MKFLLVLLLPMLVFSQDWEEKYNEVCRRDKMCSRLKDSDGTWLKPKPEIISLLKTPSIQEQIKSSAKAYGVDPRAVAGAIAAENSLNVGVKDSVQTWMASKMGITAIGGKSFSFGLGQISVPAAMDAEIYIAKIENRKPRTTEEISKEISDPMGSIRVAATIIRKVQDDYKKEGFDISNNPGVLTSLYNLGKSERRAAEAKAEGRLPQINYFGLFVEKYDSDIQKMINPAPKNKPAVKASIAAVNTRKSDIAGAETNKKPTGPLTKKSFVTSSVALTSAPLMCDSSSYGQNVAQETRSTSFGAPIGILNANESFNEISRTLDCKSSPWKLLKTDSGKIGWIKEDQLENVTSDRYEEKKSCVSQSKKNACQVKIEKASAKHVLNKKTKNGILYLKPVTASENAKAGFATEDINCGNNQSAMPTPSDGISGAYGMPVGGTNQAETPSRSELEQNASGVLTTVNSELERMSQEVGIPVVELTEPQNPYASVALFLKSVKDNNKSCLNSLRSEMFMCIPTSDLHIKQIRKFKELKYKKQPDVEEILTVQREIMNVNYNGSAFAVPVFKSSYRPDKAELESITAAELKDSLAQCAKRYQNTYWTLKAKNQSNGGSSTSLTYGLNLGLLADKASQNPDQKIETYKADLIALTKFCHARFNLIDPTESKNKLDCTQAPDFLPHQMSYFSKELLSKVYQQNPAELLLAMDQATAALISYPAQSDIMGLANTSATNQFSSVPSEGLSTASYCPNRTAEVIENLLKDNACIKQVYVPSEYLVKKLGPTDSRVIYRKFEDDGYYAIELGDELCR